MIRVPVSDTAFADNNITLSAERYVFTYRWNERDTRWRLDIYDSNDVVIYYSLKLIEGTSPTQHLENIFPAGYLEVVQLEGDDLPAGRNNLGTNKSYELLYITYSELYSGSLLES